ncbi:MAG TPA: DUF1871 family protein [Bacillus bacterium]|nr:DUF1871 family protein [Bacillus sp. (in: firmicutes)]
MEGSKNLNEKLKEVINNWDPFGLGPDAYDVEAIDIIQAVHEINDHKYLAKRIQFIYEFSFEKSIPITECQKIARRMLLLKEAGPFAV